VCVCWAADWLYVCVELQRQYLQGCPAPLFKVAVSAAELLAGTSGLLAFCALLTRSRVRCAQSADPLLGHMGYHPCTPTLLSSSVYLLVYMAILGAACSARERRMVMLPVQ